MKRVYKYGTGDDIPDGAVYLTTKTEKVVERITGTSAFKTIRLVWHYFLVEVDNEDNTNHKVINLKDILVANDKESP